MTQDVEVPSLVQGTETATEPGVTEAPTDFREFVKWRETGELPPAKEETPSAAADTEKPPAKTEPDSETDATQEQGKDQEPPEGEETDHAKRIGSRQRRIDKLTKELETERREKEELRRQIAGQPVTPAEEPSPGKPKPASAEAGKPRLDDFETLEAYQEALTDWKLDQREAARKEADAKAAGERAQVEARAAWEKKERAARKAHADFDDVLDTVEIPATAGVLAARQALLEEEAGAEILYYLGKHPKEIERIAALSPVSAVREIGKLAALLEKSPAPENGKRQITGAPKPPPPSGRPSKTSSDSIEDAAARGDFRAYSRLRMSQR